MVMVPPCNTCRTCLCAGVPVGVRDVGSRPEILMGAAMFLSFSSDDELYTNSKERESGSTAGSGALPVVKLVSVACGC